VSVVRDRPYGAYGLRLHGLADELHLREGLVRAPEHWPAVSLEQRIENPSPAPVVLNSEWARIPLAAGGHLLLDRRRRRATFVSPAPVEADILLHPALAVVGAIFSDWLGRHAIHAGAFVVDGEAWALLGERWAGKSSTLGWLAQAGSPILADDLVVIDGGTAFAGPRTLDLKTSSARYLGRDGNPVRGGVRHRVTLDGVDAEMPLRGWIALSWGDVVEARPIPPAERLRVLIENLQVRRPGPGSAALLDLATVPGFEVQRPRRLAALPEAGAKVMDLASP
jgi:hypothetical protein